jgi:fimbrial chaperone protein
MRPFAKLLIVAAAGTLSISAGMAADLRVAPATVEPPVGARTATLNVVNGEQQPLKVQIRVMRWTEQDGHEVLTPTRDLVASPPFVTLKPAERYVVRLVRIAKSPLQGEESYRVLVDQVPEPHAVRPGTVNFVLRQSIPVFFSDEPRSVSKVGWKIVRDGSNLWLVGNNSGNRHLRLSDVTLDSNGTVIYRQAGLVGYVLPGDEMRWSLKPVGAVSPNGKVHMKAASDTGPIDVSLAAAPGG